MSRPTVATLAAEVQQLRAEVARLAAGGALAELERRLAGEPAAAPPEGVRRRRHLWVVPG